MDGMRKFLTTICLVLTLLTVEMEGSISSSTSASLNKIKTSMTSAGKNVGTKVDQIYNYLNSDAGSSKAIKVASSIEGIGGAISSLTSDDPVDIVSGTLDMISTIAPLVPVGGQIIGTVFSLIGTIFGAIAGAGGEDVGSVVAREIEKALNKYDDSELKAEAAGTKRVYRNSHAYLATMEGDTPIMEHEIAALAANVPIYQGVAFLGKLANKVKQYTTHSDPNQVKRAIEYMQLYVILAVLRTSILWEMYALVKAAPNSDFTAAAIRRVIAAEDDNDKQFLWDVLLEPDYSQAFFFAYFNPSQLPQTHTFIKKKGIPYQQHDYLVSGKHHFRPEKYTNYYMFMKGNSIGNMAGTTTLDAQSRFIFKAKSYIDNMYYIKSAKWPTWYVYMHGDSNGNCRGTTSMPGHEGQWKVVQFKDGKYMLSTRKWPDKFIYMDSSAHGWIKGWKGDPGKQGHWLID